MSQYDKPYRAEPPLPKRKMPEKGSLIKVIHSDTDDLTRIKEIIERYDLKVEFIERIP